MRLSLAATAAMTALFLSGCDGGGNDSSQMAAAFMFSTNRLDVPAVWGHSDQSHTANVDVLAAGKRWNVSADAPWVGVPAGTLQGDATIPVTVDSSGMGLGAREARLTLVNADDPADTDSLIVTVVVQLPVITAPSTFTLGGPDGLDTSMQNLAFSIDTGLNSHGWTLASVTLVPNNVNWLQLFKTSGQSNVTGDVIVADADRVGLAPGIYDALLTLQFDVLGETITHEVRATLNHEENRIYAVDNGVAFYEIPSRSRLAAGVQVLSSRDLLNIPWSAVSDQPWLTVTPSGMTGGTLNLLADPSTLAADAVHTATVTITSSNPEVQNQETITVGLWKDGSNPPNKRTINAPFDTSATNPVFPYVHAARNGTLRTYNTYTGALVSTFSLPWPQTGGMSVSSDGRTVYVPNTLAGQGQVAGIDVATGQVVDTLTRGGGSRVGYVRIKGHPIVTPAQDPWFFGFGPNIAASRDDRTLFLADNSGPGHSYNGYTLDFSALLAPGRVLSQPIHATDGTDTGNVQAMALSADDSRYLAAVSGPDECRLYDGAQKQLLWAVAVPEAPNNAVARPDGLLICGLNRGGDDIRLFDLDGNEVDKLDAGGGGLLDDEMALSSDPFLLVAPQDDDHIVVLELP